MSRRRRPRHQKHDRYSRRLRRFLAAMAEKWSGEETPIDVDTVGSDVLALAETPDVAGPFTLRGAPPPELRDLARFWIAWDESDEATVYTSRAALTAGRGARTLASWPLSVALASLTADTDTVAATSAGTTVAALGTPLAISAVTNGADTLTRVAHGFALDQGPFYIASDTTIPAGLAATTPYWIADVTTVDTFKLASSPGGAVINITSDGAGAITIVPVNVDLDDNQLTKTAHGITTGQLLRLTTDGALPTGLAVATDYWAIAVDANTLAFATSLVNAQAGTKINLTAIGSGTTTVLKCNVDVGLNVLRFTSAHGLAAGDGPLRLTTDGVLPTGLATATDYYAIATSATELKLAATEAHALAGTPAVDITAIGSGTTTVTLAGADVTKDSLRAVAHGMQTGDGPVRVTTEGTLPVGLLVATDYWVIRHSANYLGLATTLELALAGTEVNLTGIGVGAHALVRALTIGKDLSAEGIREWLGQGIDPVQMQRGALEDVDAIFS